MPPIGQAASVEAIEEPVSRSRQALLRRLVLEHKAAERRRRYPATFHVGVPGRPESGRVEDDLASLDHALRCELLGAILRRVPPTSEAAVLAPMAWLTRPGAIDVQDVDLGWLRAVASVSAEAGRPLAYVVVTSTGWHDPRSGAARTWERARER